MKPSNERELAEAIVESCPHTFGWGPVIGAQSPPIPKGACIECIARALTARLPASDSESLESQDCPCNEYDV